MQDEQAFLNEVLRGHQGAILLCNHVFWCGQLFDDLIDKDKPVSDEDLMKCFWLCWVAIPSNPFYRQFFNEIQPILRTALFAWMDSVTLERRGDDHGKNIAFVLRDCMADLVIQCALLIGGYEWGRQVSVRIRDYSHDETLEDYKGGLS